MEIKKFLKCDFSEWAEDNHLTFPITSILPKGTEEWKQILPLLLEIACFFVGILLFIYALAVKFPYQAIMIFCHKLGCLIDRFPRLAVGITAFILLVPMLFLFVQLRQKDMRQSHELYLMDTLRERTNDSCYHAGYRQCLEDAERKKVQDANPVKLVLTPKVKNDTAVKAVKVTSPVTVKKQDKTNDTLK